MTETIVVALITGGLSLLGVIITNNRSSKDTAHLLDKQQREMSAKLDKQQAITDTKLDALTREVREHNNFAKRVPVLEEQIKVANHRIADLEQKH